MCARAPPLRTITGFCRDQDQEVGKTQSPTKVGKTRSPTEKCVTNNPCIFTMRSVASTTHHQQESRGESPLPATCMRTKESVPFPFPRSNEKINTPPSELSGSSLASLCFLTKLRSRGAPTTTTYEPPGFTLVLSRHSTPKHINHHIKRTARLLGWCQLIETPVPLYLLRCHHQYLSIHVRCPPQAKKARDIQYSKQKCAVPRIYNL